MPSTITLWRAWIRLGQTIKRIATVDCWCGCRTRHLLTSVPSLTERLTAAKATAFPLSIRIHVVCRRPANGDSLRSGGAAGVSGSLGTELTGQGCVPLQCAAMRRQAVCIKFRGGEILWHGHVAIGKGTAILVTVVRVRAETKHPVAVWHHGYAWGPNGMIWEDLAGINVAEIASSDEGGAGVCTGRGGEHWVAVRRIIHELIRYGAGQI